MTIPGFLGGTPEGTRTPDLLIRSQSLYPTELRAQTALDLPQLTTLIILSHLSLIVKRFEKDLEFTQLAIQFSFVFCRVSQEIQHKQFPN